MRLGLPRYGSLFFLDPRQVVDREGARSDERGRGTGGGLQEISLGGHRGFHFISRGREDARGALNDWICYRKDRVSPHTFPSAW